MKRAAVYDRWLYTLGGGEQVAFAYAQSLRDLGYKTTIITHQHIDVEKAQQKMHVDLRDISIEYLPIMSSTELSEFTEKFDVFVNTSYLDYFANRSRIGILSIFFPSQIVLTPYEYIKRAIVLPSFSNFFIYPLRYEGFKFDEYKKGKIYKWLGKKSSLVFNEKVKKFSILLFFPTFTIAQSEAIVFKQNGKPITPTRMKLFDHANCMLYSFTLDTAKESYFSIEVPENEMNESVALTKLTIFDIRYVLYNFFKRFFPKWEMRLHGGPGVTKLSDLTSYQHIVTISEFSKFWIHKYWGLASEILYPPVHTKNFRIEKTKKNWITHVGRFFVTGHNKKQLELVKAFRKIVDEHGIGNWELHLVGSIQEGGQHRQYFEQVQHYARGYPVFFHIDASFEELRSVLSQSKIYWHATGLDEDPNKDPILFEHFGITTVEAMASGCVPVVINAGGQKEIVTPESGFLWDTKEQLIEQTVQLIKSSKLTKEYSLQAQKRAMYFDQKYFKSRLAKILADEQ